MRLLNKAAAAAVVAAGLSFSATAAFAVPTPFGNATASIGATYNPTVTGTTVDLTTGSPALFSGTGQVPNTAIITVTGVITYVQTIGTVTADSITGFLSFPDGLGGTDIFDLTSVETTAFSSVNNSTALSLYLLGDLSDPTAGLTPTATSITMTLNDNNGGPYTFSATLSDPPSTPVIPPCQGDACAVPEPASLSLLGFGLVGLGALRLMPRRNRKS